MNNDQRLIPFLGGLVVGGAVGNTYNRPYYTNYYPYPNNQTYSYYPQYNYYPNQYYPEYQYNPNATYPVKMVNEQGYPIIVSSDERSISDLSYVPIYKKEN